MPAEMRAQEVDKEHWVKRGVAVFKGPNCEPYYDAFKELRWVPDLDFAAPQDAPKKP